STCCWAGLSSAQRGPPLSAWATSCDGPSVAAPGPAGGKACACAVPVAKTIMSRAAAAPTIVLCASGDLGAADPASVERTPPDTGEPALRSGKQAGGVIRIGAHCCWEVLRNSANPGSL